MRPIKKVNDGTYSVPLYLKKDELEKLRDLAGVLEKNDFETIKYCIRLVAWWAHGEIEPCTKR